MIHHTEKLRPALLELRELLIDLRYDWLYKNLKGLAYYIEPSLAGLAPAVNQQLAAVGARQSIAMHLFRFGGRLDRAAMLDLLPGSLLDQLLELGLLVEADGQLQLDGYTIVPWLGSYFITALDATRPGAHLTCEQYNLAYELMDNGTESLLDYNCGCGFVALTAAMRSRVLAVSANKEAVEVARANAALNLLDSRVKVVEWQTVLETCESIVSAESSLPLPERYRALSGAGEESQERLRELFGLMASSEARNLLVMAQCVGGEEEPAVLKLIRESESLERMHTRVFILSRSYITDTYYSLTAQIIGRRLAEAQTEELAAELKNYYSDMGAKCIYSILIDSERAASRSLDVINLSSRVTSRDSLQLPDGIELVEHQRYVLTTPSGSFRMPIDEVQKGMVEMIVEGKLLASEIAEAVAARHNLPFETAAMRSLEMCHQLFLKGIIESPTMAQLRGQMRLMQISVNRFAEKLKSMADTME